MPMAEHIFGATNPSQRYNVVQQTCVICCRGVPSIPLPRRNYKRLICCQPYHSAPLPTALIHDEPSALYDGTGQQ